MKKIKKRINKNKRGFTLVELLVTITILGIITLISLPGLTAVKNSNNDKKYDAYLNSLTYAGKIYTDSYADDMFGYKPYGCAQIKFADLVSKNLLKDIQLSGITCNSEETYVQVIKFNDKYYYTSYIGCGKKNASGGISKYDILKPKNRTANAVCTDSSASSIGIFGDPNTYTKKDKKSISVKVLVSSAAGITVNPNPPDLKYGINTSRSSEIDINNQLVFGTLPSASSQTDKIKNGIIPSIVSNPITISGLTSKNIYIVVRVNQLTDLYDGHFKSSETDPSIAYIGPFTLDNTPPVFHNVESSVVSSKSDYNDIKPKLNLNVTDTISNESDLKMCVSVKTDKCSGKSVSDYEDYVKDKVLDKISDSLNGSTGNVYIYVSDKAKNVSHITVPYTVSTEYTLNYNSDGGTSCSPKKQFAGKAWGNLCTPTKTGYSFDGWYDNTTLVTKDTPATKNLTVKAKWINDKVKLNYICSDATSGSMSPTMCTPGSACTVATNKFSKTDNNFKGFYTSATGGSKVGSKITINKDTNIYCQWTPIYQNVTITFVANGATISSTSASCKYKIGSETSCKIKTPSISRSGYTVVGWGTAAGSTTKAVSSNTNISVNKNTTYYAITYKSVTATFSYNLGTYKNITLLADGSKNTTKSCNLYNKNTTCSVTSPGCSFGKTYNKKGQQLSSYFNCQWNGVTAGNAISIKGGETIKLTVTAKSTLTGNNGKVVALSHSGSENIVVRINNTKTLYDYGVSKKTNIGWMDDNHAFYWDGDWIVDKSNKLLWFHGTTAKKEHKCTSPAGPKTCNGSTRAKMTGWISARLTFHR